jgi:hypothetical protein
MSIVITRFETARIDQRHVSDRAAIAISAAMTAMTFILFVLILA